MPQPSPEIEQSFAGIELPNAPEAGDRRCTHTTKAEPYPRQGGDHPEGQTEPLQACAGNRTLNPLCGISKRDSHQKPSKVSRGWGSPWGAPAVSYGSKNMAVGRNSGKAPTTATS